MKKMLFSFEDTAAGDKASELVARYFSRAGANVVQSDVSTSMKRSMGVSYKEMILTFADSQTVILRVKQTGDIFQVLLNKKVLPIKNQDDHAMAITEVVKAMDSGRTKFQKKLAMAKVKLPIGVRTSTPNMRLALIEKRDALKDAIAAVRSEIEQLKAAA